MYNEFQLFACSAFGLTAAVSGLLKRKSALGAEKGGRRGLFVFRDVALVQLPLVRTQVRCVL